MTLTTRLLPAASAGPRDWAGPLATADRALLAATGAEGHLLARLEADPDTLRTRIIEREPAGWAGLDELVEASQLLAGSMPTLSGVDVVLSTEGRDPESVADDLEAALREHSPSLLAVGVQSGDH